MVTDARLSVRRWLTPRVGWWCRWR